MRVEDYFAPGKWVPHCTICREVPGERMGDIVNFVRRTGEFGAVRVVSVSVVEFLPACEVRAFEFVG